MFTPVHAHGDHLENILIFLCTNGVNSYKSYNTAGENISNNMHCSVTGKLHIEIRKKLRIILVLGFGVGFNIILSYLINNLI